MLLLEAQEVTGIAQSKRNGEVVEMNMNAREQEQYRRFCQEHRQHGVKMKKIQTGVGVKMVVRCRKCKKEEDITDYASW